MAAGVIYLVVANIINLLISELKAWGERVPYPTPPATSWFTPGGRRGGRRLSGTGCVGYEAT